MGNRKGVRRLVRFDAEFNDELAAYLDQHNMEFSAETRKMWARKLGKPSSAAVVKMGRPTKEKQP